MSFLRSVERRDYGVELIHDRSTFCRILVTERGEQLLIDLPIDSPPHDPPTVTILGPTMSPRELAGRKLLALFGRAEVRDFSDVYVLGLRFGNDVLLDQAAVLDAGFDRGVLAQMMGTIVRFDDDEIPLTTADAPMAPRTFPNGHANWEGVTDDWIDKVVLRKPV